MKYLIERLRAAATKPNGWAILGALVATEAADALERLTAENAALTKVNGEWTVACADLRVRLAEADAHGKAQQRWAHEWRDKADELEALLREALDALPTKSDYESRVQYLRELRDRIDAHLARETKP